MAYGGKMGYIVPADAPLPTRDKSGFLAKTIDMKAFENHALRIQSKHALFIFDSCFSGSIFDMSRNPPPVISYNIAKPVRQFITAGDETETVPDRSIFKEHLLLALRGAADLNDDSYVTGTELGMFLEDKVSKYSKGSQHPKFGKIRDSKLDKGDYVFVIPVKPVPPSQPVKLPDQKSDMNLRAYEEEANQLAIAKKEWKNWQTKMNSYYNRIIKLDSDENLPSIRKLEMWQDFLDTYSKDNPYSVQDEELRRKAQSRKKHWQNINERPAAKIPKSSSKKEISKPITWANRTTNDMMYIEGGTFQMGSNDGEDDEKPVHTVTVDGFYMDKYEVTNEQFCKFLNKKGKHKEGFFFKKTWLDIKRGSCKIEKGIKYRPKKGFENHPVIEVTWYGAKAYAEWAGKRLATEVEWEYAARGGDKSRGYKYSGSNNPGEVAWYEDNSGGKTHPVWQKKPNELGLYDMSGNVWEWCSDWYGEDYYRKSPSKNPTGPESGSTRVLRGGSKGNDEYDVRAAIRGSNPPTNSDDYVGFRCVR